MVVSEYILLTDLLNKWEIIFGTENLANDPIQVRSEALEENLQLPLY